MRKAVNIYLDDDERTYIRDYAQRKGISVSAVITKLIIRLQVEEELKQRNEEE